MRESCRAASYSVWRPSALWAVVWCLSPRARGKKSGDDPITYPASSTCPAHHPSASRNSRNKRLRPRWVPVHGIFALSHAAPWLSRWPHHLRVLGCVEYIVVRITLAGTNGPRWCSLRRSSTRARKNPYGARQAYRYLGRLNAYLPPAASLFGCWPFSGSRSTPA